jgi:CHAD domain-containing protein
MAMKLDRVEKPLGQLRKSLKGFPKDPPPETVHKLRTRARHIEAIAATLTEPDEKKTRRLLRSIKPVRKAAGGVRDMDVLTGNALSLRKNSHSESLTRLVQHLGVERQKSAQELVDAVGLRRKSARQSLKKYARHIREAFADGNPDLDAAAQRAECELHIHAVAADKIREISHHPALNVRNIHPFRLKVKELRSILQLFPDSDSDFVEALGRTKDRIGDWHDWQQLSEVAQQILDPRRDRALLMRIDKIGKQKLRHALSASNTLRKRYLKA